ncbi:MAG: hypothetical protein GY876_11825, partial [Planctomycetes bacterium]|nr:hypothetical protein [Planctomycetota bacterium]
MKRYAIGVAVLAVTGTVCAQAVQWTEAEGGNGHWYAELNEELVWPDADAAALEIGARLVTITSLGEFEYLTTESGLDLSNRFGGAYQDLEAPDYDEPYGGWRWSTGETFDWEVMDQFMGADDCPGGSPGSCGCGPDGMQNSLMICCVDQGSPWLDDVGDGIVGGCDSQPRRSIIEWSADCNGDGIVDYGQILDGTYADDDGNGVPDCCDAGEPCDAVQWIEADGGNGHWYSYRLGDLNNA